MSASFNNDFELRYWRVDQRLPDPADVPVFNYVEQVNRFNGQVHTEPGASGGSWTFAWQVDEVALFANRYYLDDVLVLERDLTLPTLWNVFPGQLADTAYVNVEKVRATHEADWGTVTLGDAYVAFGRGVALNLNRNVDIDIDTSIQGARALLRPGAWDITVVAGQANRQQVWQDNPNLALQGDLRHFVAGVRAERFGLGPANLGGHAVAYNFTQTPGLAGGFEEIGTPLDAVVGGLTAEVIGVGGIDTYVEADLFSYSDAQPTRDPEAGNLGSAVYLSAAAYPKPFVVLFELKRYDQAERVNATLTPELYEIAIAPTLEYERVITEDSSAAINSNDVLGARVQIDWTAVPQKVVPYVAFAVFRDAELGGLHFNEVPENIFHPTAGVEWIDSETALLLNTGIRTDDRDGQAGGFDRQVHGDVSFNFPLPGRFVGYLSAQAEAFHWGNNALQQADYVEMETGSSLSWRSALTGTLYLDFTTNPLVSTTGNVTDAVYAAGELQVKPTSAWTVKAFYGAQKAGIRCSGGQCRLLPGFSGARFSVVGSF